MSIGRILHPIFICRRLTERADCFSLRAKTDVSERCCVLYEEMPTFKDGRLV
jgi:hypothetical protein